MKVNVTHLAQLANLPILDQEKTQYESQLEESLEKINDLDELNTKNVLPTSQVTGLENVLRQDVPLPSLSQGQATKNSKDIYKGFFKVKAILDNE